jgi:Cys-rich repeat protein
VACTVDAQCPSGQTCQANVCTAPGASCTSDDACASGQACFVSQNSTHTAFTAACQPGNAGKALGGEACAANTDCFSGRCFIYAAAPTDGICVDACDPATGGSNCGFSATCPSTGVVFYLPGPNGMYDPTTPSDDVWASTNVCWPMTCTTDSDCLFLAANSSDRACSPQPTSATAPNDYAKTALYCMPSFGVGGLPDLDYQLQHEEERLLRRLLDQLRLPQRQRAMCCFAVQGQRNLREQLHALILGRQPDEQ